MRSQSSSLAGRALLAVFLTIGFYGLALAVAAALLFIPYAELRYAHRLHARLALFCVASAGVILWSIVPRRDRFIPPGPPLEAGKHPRLFKEVADIAGQTNQAMPAEIYLIPAVNAFVAERGGLMGLGGRRVMGVGLPLLQTLTVPQFRAVLAHEFGHYYGGDTKLSPWIYKTRQVIIRTVMGLDNSAWLQAPFRWYAQIFLRVTHAVSRRQEFVADALAASTVGVQPFAKGLQTIHSVSPAFEAYWKNEIAPVLEAGYRPHLAEGFVHFIESPAVAETMQKIVKQEMDSAKTNPYDTHPSLAERITAVQALPPGPAGDDGQPAISLLNDVPALEHSLLVHLYGVEQVSRLPLVEWQNVGAQVYLPAWQKALQNYAPALKNITPAFLPEFLRLPDRLALILKQAADRPLSQAELSQGVNYVVGMALALALARRGWAIQAAPGTEITLRRGEMKLRPFAEVAKLAAGDLAVETWLQRCRECGLTDLDLGEPAGELANQPGD